MEYFEGSDLVYLLSNANRTDEKFQIFVYPTIDNQQQAIILVPHVSTIYYEVKKLKLMDIKAIAYTSKTEYHIRDKIREKFLQNKIQFLYATPRMYFANKFFKSFVNHQVVEGNLSAIVFDDAKYLFE